METIRYKIKELKKEYIAKPVKYDESKNNSFDLLDIDELKYIKDFMKLPDNALYLVKGFDYYIKNHNTFIKTYKKSSMVYAMLYTEKHIEWNNRYHKELDNDLNKYKLTREKIDKIITRDSTTTAMDTSSLFGEELSIQNECNIKSEARKLTRRRFYNELFVEKIKVNSTEEYFISKHDNHKDREIQILNWKSDKALKLLELPLHKIQLKGYYTPDKENLLDVRYEDSKKNKHYFENAEYELYAKNKKKKKKIDIGSFFALQEKIPSAEQAQIHTLKNKSMILIEGSAGTGKTTTALERLAKLNHDNVIEKRLCVITKDDSGNQYLKKFLNNLSLKNIHIFTIDNFIEKIKISQNFNQNDLEKSEIISSAFELFYKNIDTNIDFYNNKKEILYLIGQYEKMNDSEKIISYINSMIDKQISAKKRYEKLKKSVKPTEKEQKHEKEIINLLEKDIVKLQNIYEFNKTDIEFILQITRQDRAYWETRIFIENKNIVYNVQEDVDISIIKYISKIILTKPLIFYFIDKIIKHKKQLFISESDNKKEIIKQLSLLYIENKFLFPIFDTIVIDEGQDFSYQEIELCRLRTKNLIITGDRLQKISKKGIDNWNELYKFDELYKNNIYELTLNFRQTYELSNASFNFRKSILNENFKDISSEYFSNQKGFPLPSLEIIPEIDIFKNRIKDIIQSIKDNYISKFPLAIIYFSEEEKDSFLNIFCKHYKIGAIDANSTNFDKNEIILIHINEIKGKEFPIIVSYISGLTDKIIYLIMSRANFELYLFIKDKNELPIHYAKMNTEKMIEIKF